MQASREQCSSVCWVSDTAYPCDRAEGHKGWHRTTTGQGRDYLTLKIPMPRVTLTWGEPSAEYFRAVRDAEAEHTWLKVLR